MGSHIGIPCGGAPGAIGGPPIPIGEFSCAPEKSPPEGDGRLNDGCPFGSRVSLLECDALAGVECFLTISSS
jgi:hypothetical protein